MPHGMNYRMAALYHKAPTAVRRSQTTALVARGTMHCGGGTYCRKIGEPPRHRACCLTTVVMAFGRLLFRTLLVADVSGRRAKWESRMRNCPQRLWQQPRGFLGNPPSADLAAARAAGAHAVHHRAVVVSGVQAWDQFGGCHIRHSGLRSTEHPFCFCLRDPLALSTVTCCGTLANDIFSCLTVLLLLPLLLLLLLLFSA
mmetsp:Transcript_82431/g.163562  ORF Transcript_82431/g.163562 Transcript_82431/m.163562 type:complete len:200 (-) Transcript_82431:43-642(-)